MPFKVIEITEFSKDGNGKEGNIEVPFSCPGDQINALLLRKKKGIIKGRIEEILKPSEKRIQPKCIHFGSCGGCRWQHISYDEQLKEKEGFVKRYFFPATILPIIPCFSPWQYRNKMEYSFSNDQAGNYYLGLIMADTRGHVFQMKECHLTHPWFYHTLDVVTQWWKKSGLKAFNSYKNTGSLRNLTIREGRRTGDRMVILTVSGNPEYALNKTQLQEFQTTVKESQTDLKGKLSIFLRIHQALKGHPTQFYEMLLDGPDHIEEYLEVNGQKLKFRISPSAFFQPCTEQAEKLYQKALDLVAIPENGIVFDLYCGTGTLGICAAKKAKEVISIELSPESVLDARENVKLNEFTNVEIIQGDVGKVLGQIQNKKPDLVMVDPPRMGLDKQAISHLLKLQAKNLLYISCNPQSQAVNVNELVLGGYRLKAIQPVDQFPQTAHVENIVILSKEEL